MTMSPGNRPSQGTRGPNENSAPSSSNAPPTNINILPTPGMAVPILWQSSAFDAFIVDLARRSTDRFQGPAVIARPHLASASGLHDAGDRRSIGSETERATTEVSMNNRQLRRHGLTLTAVVGALACSLFLDGIPVTAQNISPTMLVPNLSVRPVVSGLTQPTTMAFIGENDL